MIINFFRQFLHRHHNVKIFWRTIESKRCKGGLFSKGFLSEHNFRRNFLSKLQDTKLSFQEIIYNFFYGRNLQILNVQIAIRKLANPRNENLKVFGIFIKRAFLLLPWTRPCRLREDLLATIKKCLNMLFLKIIKKQNWLVDTYCKLQWCSFLNINLPIIIP